MIYDQLVPRIKQRLGMRTDLDDMIRLEIDLAQAELENRPELPWFLKKDWVVQGDIDGVNLLNTITKDDDFLLLQDRKNVVRVVDEQGVQVPLIRLPYASLSIKTSAGTVTGLPAFFAEHDDLIYFNPRPDIRYTFNIACYRREMKRSAMPDNKQLQTNAWYKYASELIIWATVLNCATLLQWPDKVSEAMTYREMKSRELLHRSIAMEEAARLRELSPDPEYGDDYDN